MKQKDIPEKCKTCLHMKAWNLRMDGDHDFACRKKPPRAVGKPDCDKYERYDDD